MTDKKGEFSKNWEKRYQQHWKPLITTDGKIDEEKLKNELHDLAFVGEQVAHVYYVVTGGKLSKPFYFASSVEGVYNEQLEDAYNDGYEEGRKDEKEEADLEALNEYPE